MKTPGESVDIDSMGPSIEVLRRALESDERVATVVLFGSVAQGFERGDSDLDLGLVARTVEGARSLRANLLELAATLSLSAMRDVQLVLLDDVEPVLGRQVFAYGRKLLERDPRRSADCLERILIEYFDGAHHRRMMQEALDARLAARG